MRAGTFGLLAASAMTLIMGCASAPRAVAQAPMPAPAAAPTDPIAAMNAELAHTLDAPPVGTTTLASATLDTTPMPESRGSVSEYEASILAPEPVVATWGVAAPSEAPAFDPVTDTRE